MSLWAGAPVATDDRWCPRHIERQRGPIQGCQSHPCQQDVTWLCFVTNQAGCPCVTHFYFGTTNSVVHSQNRLPAMTTAAQSSAIKQGCTAPCFLFKAFHDLVSKYCEGGTAHKGRAKASLSLSLCLALGFAKALESGIGMGPSEIPFLRNKPVLSSHRKKLWAGDKLCFCCF